MAKKPARPRPSSKQKPSDHNLGRWTRVKIGETRTQGIEDLAWLQTAVRQGEPITDLPVYVTVSCARPHLSVEDVSFELATWQVLIRLELENASVKFGSRRTVKVQEGHFQSETTSKTTLLTIREHAFALGLDAQAKTSGSRGSASTSIFGKLNIKRSKKLSDSGTDKTKAINEIILIGPYGEAIAIGDPEYGDPHKPNGLLSYDYPKDEGEDSKPLFALEPIDSALPMRISVMTTVPFDKLYLSSRAASAQERILAREEIHERSIEAVDAHETLRRRMFRDELASRISRNQARAGLPVRAGEFAVMIESFEIRPTVDGETGGTKIG